MKGVSHDVEGPQFRIGDSDACRIGLAILDSRHLQSFFGGGMGDQLNDCFQRRQGLSPPVDGNERKEPMFDLVPRAR
jgi:hypothetical protein